MKQNFNDCLNRLLKDEGGYTNDPSDNGGPTNFGITLADYRKYINRKGTAENVKNMSVDEAKSIYRSKYWDALSCDTLSSGVDYTCFDYGVNSGLGRPRKALQTFSDKSGTNLIEAINNERTAFLRGLAASQAHDQKFLKGWLARVKRVNDYSLQLAKKNYSASTGSIFSITLITGYLSTVWHDHPYLVVGAGLSLAVITGLIVHKLINKGK